MDDVNDVIGAMGQNGVMRQIESCMTEEQKNAVDSIWAQAGNITWFEAFSIWLLRSRGFESLP